MGDVDGYRTFFNKPLDYQFGSCADPNGGNSYKSLRANSCDHCAELCRLTGGCNYWTWVPHFLEPNGHRHCKLYKNYCCFRCVSRISRISKRWIKNQKKWNEIPDL